MNRRHLLGLGLGAALVPVAARSPLIGGGAAAPESLSFGYAPAEGGALVHANRLREGDRSLSSSGVQLRVIDFVQPPGASGASLAMDVRFEPFHEATFRAWQSRDGLSAGSSPVGLRVPIDRKAGLRFILVRGESSPAAETIEGRLIPGSGAGPKLRPGYYAVALDPDHGTLDWRRYAIAIDRGLPTLTGTDGTQPPFVYGLLGVAPSA
ncbi:MAG: hypothetical protein WD557_01500 [Dehalococcoidia bacterium]